MKKQLLFSLFLVAAILMSPSNGAQAVVLSIPHADGETLTANPGSQTIYIIDKYGSPETFDSPIYAIVQPGCSATTILRNRDNIFEKNKPGS